jgi:hypothetical protein
MQRGMMPWESLSQIEEPEKTNERKIPKKKSNRWGKKMILPSIVQDLPAEV